MQNQVGKKHVHLKAIKKYNEWFPLNVSSHADRVEVSDGVENVDMSLEELQQLLLRSHQQGAVEAGASAVMDVSDVSVLSPVEPWIAETGWLVCASILDVSAAVRALDSSAPNPDALLPCSPALQPFSLSLPLTEWNFTEMESNLKSVSQPIYMSSVAEALAVTLSQP